MGGLLTIRLPWSLPELTASASLNIEDIEGQCKQLEVLLAQVNVTLSFMYPILRIVDCVKLLIDIVVKITEALSVVTSPVDLANKLLEIANLLGDLPGKCIDLFAELTFVVPTPFCRLVADIMIALIALIDCIIQMATISIGLGDRVVELNASGDVDLALQADCLVTQKAALDAAIQQKLESIESLVDIVNVLIGLVPPLALAMGANYPINLGAMTIDIPGLNALRDKLVLVRDIALTCALWQRTTWTRCFSAEEWPTP